MKNKGNQVLFLKKVFLTFLIIGLGYSPIYSSNVKETKDGIEWDKGYWRKKQADKDLFYPPITAYIESSLLYIRNDKPEGALNIAIVSGKSGRVVWEQVVPEAATSLVTIPLDTLPAGEYTLQLANEWGGYLCGSFRK